MFLASHGWIKDSYSKTTLRNLKNNIFEAINFEYQNSRKLGSDFTKKMIWLSRKIFYERWSFTRTVFVSLWVFHWTLAIQICAFKCLIDVSPTTSHLLNFEIFSNLPPLPRFYWESPFINCPSFKSWVLHLSTVSTKSTESSIPIAKTKG